MLSQKMKATSTYTMQNIDNRLEYLRDQGPQADADAEAERQREILYLVELRDRKSADITEAPRGDG